MKNIALSVFFAILIVACVAKEAKDKKSAANQATTACCSASADTTLLAISVDELLASPDKYLDKKVDLSGMVVHTCKKSGKKMFLTGSNDSIYVKVEAGDKISKFDPSLEGSNVVASGVLTVITTGEEHHEHAEGETCASEGKGKDYVLTCESFKTL